MSEPAIDEATAELDAAGVVLARIGQQILRPSTEPGAPADALEASRARIKEHEQELLDWIDTAERWLRIVNDHLTEHAPKALLTEESDALWTGTQLLRRDFRRHVFGPGSTLAMAQPDVGADMRRAPLEDAYRELFKKLEPYRELIAILDQDPAWKQRQPPTEIHATLEKRTADAEAIRKQFGEYRLHADTLLAELRAFIESERAERKRQRR